MNELMRESGWLVAADEAVTTADDARRVCDAGAGQVINIKLMKGEFSLDWKSPRSPRSAASR
jgi:L-alanine-DL-glutamate epimerase-like enolase superfamily enzyme